MAEHGEDNGMKYDGTLLWWWIKFLAMIIPIAIVTGFIWVGVLVVYFDKRATWRQYISLWTGESGVIHATTKD